MKFIAALLALSMTIMVFGEEVLDRDRVRWENFKQNHGRRYNRTDEDGKRMKLFLSRDARINKHNRNPNKTYTVAHNKFSDKTDEELLQYLGTALPFHLEVALAADNSSRAFDSDSYQEITEFSDDNNRQLSSSLDYRTNRCLQAIKNQRSCGSCWAFATITVLEFNYCKKYGTPLSLSDQQLTDCVYPRSGCLGGWYSDSFSYARSTKIVPDVNYPYRATYSGSCGYNRAFGKAQVATYSALPANNPSAMITALTKDGPLAVAIMVETKFFIYGGGIYTEPCKINSVNHAVVIVGYGTFGGRNVWIVRNSWGTGWGTAGYIYMLRGINHCNIERYPFSINSMV